MNLPALLLAGAFLAAGCGSPYAVRHRVQAGENLATISSLYGLTEREVREFNRLEAGDRVDRGDIVFVPGPRRPSAPTLQRASGPTDTPAQMQTPPGASVPPPPPRAEAAPPPVPTKASQANRTRLVWPVRGAVLRGFGSGPAGDSHGLDIGAPPGTSVRAADRGVVTYAGTPARAYGPLIILAHSGDLFTVYSNLEGSRVEKGQGVEAGQVIGTSGSEGSSMPPHLHFEVRRNEKPADPLLFLPAL